MASHLLEKVAQDGTNSLRERVYRHLEAALREGQLHHGTCLDQDRLCEELGVSRTPLRDALLRLEAEGFVTIQPRKGVYITPVSDAFVKSACQILGALEADCLDTVFPLLTSRHIRQLEESNKRQEQFLERRQAVEYHAENARFHDIFLSLSSNTLLYQTIGPLRRRLDMLPDHPLAYEQARAALNDHCRIIDSLKMKNRTAAVSVLRHEHWAPVRFLCPKSAKLSRVASAAAQRSAAEARAACFLKGEGEPF